MLASPSFCLHNIYIKETRAIQKLHEKRNVRKLLRIYSLDISEQKGKTILGEQIYKSFNLGPFFIYFNITIYFYLLCSFIACYYCTLS